MRGNPRNDGRGPLEVSVRGDLPVRRFGTDNAVFSTPVIGADETVYVGSADKTFYAFDPVTGNERWRFATKEVIDSAACIGPDGTVYVPCGDARLVALHPGDGKQLWEVNLLESGEFSPSTIYWLEANVAMGPNGWLYFGCDNFRFYAVEPGKGIRWSHLTGMHIWSCPAFPDEHTVVVPSFDMHLYAFDAATGRVRWKSDLGNFIASSPAVGPDGTLYLGGFDRTVRALDGRTGKTLWSVETDAAVYASPAVAADGTLYIGSHDGRMYALDAATGAVRWTFHTPSPIQGSAALGTDPEGKVPYLVYAGGGDGRVYALDPAGECRWSYDTVTGERTGRSHAINASIALGRHGLATSTAGGEILYIPYDAYLRPDRARAFAAVPRTNGRPEVLAVGADGRTRPLKNGDRLVIAPGEALSLRVTGNNRGHRATSRLRGKGLSVGAPAGRKKLGLETLLSPDGTLAHLLPDPHAAPGRYAVRAKLPANAGRGWETVERTFQIEVRETTKPADLPLLPPFRISNMLVSSPPIVASFDQIGIASLSIDVRIVHADRRTGAVTAWGVQKFGMDADGSSVGVPCPRFAVYAFGGRYHDGVLSLRSRNCQFEITAFQVPLDRLEFTLTAAGGTLRGGTMFAEVRLRDMAGELLPPGLKSLPAALGRLLPQTMPAARKSFDAAVKALSPGKLGGAVVGMGQVSLLSLRMLLESSWKPWGLFDTEGNCRSLGTFRATAIEPRPAPLHVRDFRFDAARKRVTVTFGGAGGNARSAVPGIVLIDLDSGEPVPLNYCLYADTERDDQGVPTRCTLRIPAWAEVRGRIRALAMVDTEVRAKLDLHAASGWRQALTAWGRWLGVHGLA